MLSQIEPKTGNILISEPFMLDDNFRRSVVLLTECTEEGGIGYILNYRSNLLLKDVFSDCGDVSFPIFIGGPVAPDTLNFIHSCPDKISGGLPIGNGLYWGGDFEILKLHINNYSISKEEIKFFIGYSGWTPKQLTDEIKINSWIVSDKFNPAIVFDDSEHDIWKESIINMGEKFAHIVNFPENPQWN